FLELRVGIGDRPASVVLSGAGGSAVPLLSDVPVTVRLSELGVVGIAGPRADSRSLARAMTMQAAILHSPDDLQIVVVTDTTAAEEWSFARWLPHAGGGSARVAWIANTASTITRIAAEVAALVDERLRDSDGTQRDHPDTAVLVVLDGAFQLGSVPSIARVLGKGPSVGVFSICVDDAEQLLPEECRATLSVPASPRLSLRVSGSPPRDGVVGDLVSPQWCEIVARAIAPFRLNRRSDETGALPGSLRLLDLLGLEPPTPSAVAEWWARDGRTTASAVGLSPTGPLVLDLRRDGPHGLVAGTTGSGKSELLQSLIASLAVANRPEALNFVLVDYKGGSAFKECARLPHTVGMVTDLDGHLTERALVSLAAELHRREVLFREAGVTDIDGYWRTAADTGHPSLARLMMVIDEFATLVEELPDFVDGLVDIARRGRSLGVHLILATQRPSGVISPAIRTNTNLRVAMRVTDAADSTDVIDSPLASRIGQDLPGRGYLRVGHNQLTEFQAARVGGLRPLTPEEGTAVSLWPVGWLELGEPIGEPKRSESSDEATDLSVLVEAIGAAARSAGTSEQPSPWLPPLPGEVHLAELDAPSGELCAAFGLEDHPAEQAWQTAVMELERSGHLLVVGDAGSGRSTFLRTVAASIARSCPGQDVHLFGIDCGSGALLGLAELPQCGAVVSRAEVDRLDRLVTRLMGEVVRRQQVLARGGYASIADQRARSVGTERLPYVVVLVDRWEGLVASFDSLDNGRIVTNVLQLMRESASVGIRFVVAGDRGALTGRLTSLADTVYLLRMNDRSAYSLGGLNPRTLPSDLPPGRAVTSGLGLEVQVALLDGEANGPGQAEALAAVVSACQARDAALSEEQLPGPIGILPQFVAISSVPRRPGSESPVVPTVLAGVGGDRLRPRYVELGAGGPGFLVAGPPGSGRSSALVTMARSLLEVGTKLVLVTFRPSPLRSLESAPGVLASVDGRAVSPEALSDALGLEGAVVLVDDVELAVDVPVTQPLLAFYREARDRNSALIAAGATDDLARALRGLVPEVRKSRKGLLLCPSGPADGEVLGIRLPRTATFSGPPGRAVLVEGESLLLVQVPLAEDDAF
ncbi:MAG: Protein essC, partial [Acidimicrobiaceae bacterium]|nr:Protein essC [Acidimicrobiaceae bacterium]